MCSPKIVSSGPNLFIRGPENLGIGVAALGRVSTDPRPEPASMYSARYMVQKSFNSLGRGYAKLQQVVPETSLLGNGSNYAGQMALQNLFELQRQAAGG